MKCVSHFAWRERALAHALIVDAFVFLGFCPSNSAHTNNVTNKNELLNLIIKKGKKRQEQTLTHTFNFDREKF